MFNNKWIQLLIAIAVFAVICWLLGASLGVNLGLSRLNWTCAFQIGSSK